MSRTRSILLVLASLSLSGSATAQQLGTFSWQLQPYCNVVTLAITQNGAVYTLDGVDDLCGAAQAAPLVGAATLNGDGTVGIGLHIVAGGRGVQVDARITPGAFSGPWTDSAGHSGTFAFGARTGGGPRPPASTVVTGSAVVVTGAVSAASASVSGVLSAGSATVAGALSAASATVAGAVSAGSATVTGALTAGSIATPAVSTLGNSVYVADNLYARSLTATNGTAYVNSFGFAPTLDMTRANGSPTSSGFVTTGDPIGVMQFSGYLSSPSGARRRGAVISAIATENWTSGNGASLTFATGPNGSNTVPVRMIIDQNGEVGIGTVTPDQLLSVNGNASKVGGGSWAVFSDERLKVLHGDFTRGLAEVLRLRPLRFEYRADNALGLRGAGEYVGFSAQAVQAVVPEAVTRADNGYLQLHNDPLLWTMLNAIRELKAENDALKAQLEARLTALEAVAARPR